MTEITVKIFSMFDIWQTFDFLIYFLTHVHVSFVVIFQINDLVMVITKFSFNLWVLRYKRYI